MLVSFSFIYSYSTVCYQAIQLGILTRQFPRKAADVHSIKAVLGAEGKHVQIISKIENKEGIDNVDEIIEAR